MRNTHAFAPASLTARLTMCSPTNFDLAYPVGDTLSKSICSASGTGEEAAEFSATEIDDAKKSWAGRGRFTPVDNSRRLCRPLMCGSKLLRERLKLTGQAMWMISEHSRFSNAKAEGSRPKVGLVRSLSKAKILCWCCSGTSRWREESEVKTRCRGLEPRTGQ